MGRGGGGRTDGVRWAKKESSDESQRHRRERKIGKQRDRKSGRKRHRRRDSREGSVDSNSKRSEKSY